MIQHVRVWDQGVAATNAFVNRMAKTIPLAQKCMHVPKQRHKDYAQMLNRPHISEAWERALLCSKGIKLGSAGTPKLQLQWLGPSTNEPGRNRSV